MSEANNSIDEEKQQQQQLEGGSNKIAINCTLFAANNTLDEERQQQQQQQLEALVPPIAGSEHFRDVLLRFLDSKLVQYLGLAVIFVVVVAGAFFFFMMIGAQTLCNDPSRFDCQPRNAGYNVSVQILVGLFTYMCIISMPWRAAQFLHVAGWGCPHRSNEISCNVYGIPDDPDIWCYIPLKRRMGILIVLILQCVTQFMNQAARIVYMDYESSDVVPGKIWVNVLFVAAFVCAGIGAGWIFYEEGLLRTERPGQFGPGPIDSLKQAIADYRARKAESNAEAITGDDDDGVGVGGSVHHNHHPADPTRAKNRASVLGAGDGRAALRLFAM